MTHLMILSIVYSFTLIIQHRLNNLLVYMIIHMFQCQYNTYKYLHTAEVEQNAAYTKARFSYE